MKITDILSYIEWHSSWKSIDIGPNYMVTEGFMNWMRGYVPDEVIINRAYTVLNRNYDTTTEGVFHYG